MTDKQMNIRSLGMEASYLAGCALHGLQPESLKCDPERLYRFCKFHSITSIVAMALEELWKNEPASPEIMKKWRDARDKAIRKNMLLNAERERILAHLESIGCWYMPLKGSLLQFDYPKFGMRQMSDNDILYDGNRTQEVHEFLTSDGYQAVTYLVGNHDEYIKKPVYNMELHRSLFMSSANPELAQYYADVKARLIRDTDNGYGYHFSREDFYIFMVAHGYKHYLHGGVGIRTLMDAYVFTKRHADALDWAYIERELRLLNAWDFDVECRQLADKLFAQPDLQASLSKKEQDALDLYFSSGAFGTAERVVENRVDAISREGGSFSKLRYVFRRLFPGPQLLKDRYHFLNRHPWLLPVAYVMRLFSVLQQHRRIARELNNLEKAKK